MSPCQKKHLHCEYIPAGHQRRVKPTCRNSTCVHKNGELQVRVMPGGYYVGYGNIRVTTTLGSCVAACIRDPLVGVGGINHFMLPSGCDSKCDCWSAERSTRYGSHAMNALINEVIKRGGCRSRLEIKLFGGGHVVRDMSCDVGARNIAFVRQFIAQEGLRVSASDLGSGFSRRLIYDVSTGRVQLKQMQGREAQRVKQHDRQLLKRLCREARTAGREAAIDG